MFNGDTSGENIVFVKDSLFKFITSRIPNADLSVIDDIILSYVYSTFEGGSEEFFSQLNGKLYLIMHKYHYECYFVAIKVRNRITIKKIFT